MKINSLKKQKHEYPIHILDKALKGTVVTRALKSFREGSLEITRTVSFKFTSLTSNANKAY